jgi:heterodisulfide reductase subunit C
LKNIDIAKLDKDFKYQVAARPGADYFKRCFSCGTCTASCPVSEIDPEFNPRLFIRMALLGMKKELLSSDLLWYCTQCYTCYARCPQDVRFTDVMAVLREMAVEQGYADPAMPDKAKQVERLTQELRHGITEYALLCAGANSIKGKSEQLKAKLEKGLKELQK